MLRNLRRRWARLRGRRYGSWMWTSTGIHFYPLDPRAEEVDYRDVARGTAFECRYAGQITKYYSVAEHEVTVSRYAGQLARERGWSQWAECAARRWGLHHDDAEAYIGDMIRPLKYEHEMWHFRQIDREVEAVIIEHFQLQVPRYVRALVDEVDNRILVDEITALIPTADLDRVRQQFGLPLDCGIRGLSPAKAEQEWLAEYTRLESRWAALASS